MVSFSSVSSDNTYLQSDTSTWGTEVPRFFLNAMAITMACWYTIIECYHLTLRSCRKIIFSSTSRYNLKILKIFYQPGKKKKEDCHRLWKLTPQEKLLQKHFKKQ